MAWARPRESGWKTVERFRPATTAQGKAEAQGLALIPAHRTALSLNKLFQPKEAFQQSLKSFFCRPGRDRSDGDVRVVQLHRKNTTAWAHRGSQGE